MTMVSVPDFDSYIDYLEANPDEFRQLFNTILINVTAFFRDGAPWDALRTELIPELLAGARSGGRHPHLERGVRLG